MLHRLKYTTAGESHGPKLTAILEGMPSNVPIDLEQIQQQMARRQKGYGSGGRMAIEKDEVKISSGVLNGLTTGGPIAIELANKDWKNWAQKSVEPMSTPRPGHCDLIAGLKYQYPDLRLGLERSSARETAMRVACGAICRQFLDHLGVKIGGFVRSVGSSDLGELIDEKLKNNGKLLDLFNDALSNSMACPIPERMEDWKSLIYQCMQDRDTLGGVVQVFALGVPVGLGSYVDYRQRLDARLGFAMLSVQAMKGVEIGPAFRNSRLYGSHVHDEIGLKNGEIHRSGNSAGGVEAGMTTGQVVDVRVAMKPISTILKGLNSVDLATGDDKMTTYERSDFCAIARAVPILEAMLSLVLCDSLLEELGGSDFETLRTRFAKMKPPAPDSYPLKNKAFGLNYYGYNA